MNKQEYLLIKLAEEASEIAQMAIKTAQFGMDEVYQIQDKTNSERLAGEITDLKAVIEMIEDHSGINLNLGREAMDKKKEKVNFYMGVCKNIGSLDKDVDS